jgi:hypothetical protein
MTTQRSASSKSIDAPSKKALDESVRWALDTERLARRAAKSAHARHFAAGVPIVFERGDKLYRKTGPAAEPELVRDLDPAKRRKRTKI